MSCAFDLEHYRELLEAAKAGGYRFAFFEGAPKDGDLSSATTSTSRSTRRSAWRSSRPMRARRATYFLMTGSVFYNLSSPEGERALARLRELGHRVGLHAVYPRLDLDERFDPVSPGTTPIRSTCARRSTVRST